MNKQEYLQKLDELALDKNKYCIISGGVMLMLGLRDKTSDIDIKVTSDYFEELKSRFNFKKSPKFSYLYELSDEVEVAVQDFTKESIEYVDGYPINKIENELDWKIKNNREKDKPDIERIKKYLRRRELKWIK